MEALTIPDTVSSVHGESQFHVVPWLGHSDYGDVSEILSESNAECARAILSDAGVESVMVRRKTWLCNVRVFLVDVSNPIAAQILGQIRDSLELYPVLDEEDFLQRGWDHCRHLVVECAGCTAGPGEECRWGCLSRAD